MVTERELLGAGREEVQYDTPGPDHGGESGPRRRLVPDPSSLHLNHLIRGVPQ